MSFIMRNESFVCENCGQQVVPHPSGSARNHCPYCLYSKHVDSIFPGDRASHCHGLMRPIDIDYHKNKGDMIRHRCDTCGKTITNIVAPDDRFIEFVRSINATKII